MAFHGKQRTVLAVFNNIPGYPSEPVVLKVFPQEDGSDIYTSNRKRARGLTIGAHRFLRVGNRLFGFRPADRAAQHLAGKVDGGFVDFSSPIAYVSELG